MKIFEIGLMKTGTSSLGRAYEIMGFTHKGFSESLCHLFYNHNTRSFDFSNYDINIYNKLFDEIDKYDSFEDGPWHDIDFRILDEKYPGSKFILLERDNESWIKSLEYHTAPYYNVNNIEDKYLDYQWIEDRNSTIKKYIDMKTNKYNKIIEYFKDRKDDLLVFKISENWQPLCNFLNVPIPNVEFPKLNVSKVPNSHKK